MPENELSTINKKIIKKFEREMTLRNFAPTTKRTYSFVVGISDSRILSVNDGMVEIAMKRDVCEKDKK